ncbi:MAG: Kazal-type serine protease inhibitor domain-containing protein [Bacteroidota bacterium]
MKKIGKRSPLHLAGWSALLLACLAVTACKDDDTDFDGCTDLSRIDQEIACLDVFDPVCGCDGNTYGNACVAEFMAGVVSWTPGSCPTADCIDPARIDSTVICNFFNNAQPVCGCNGRTYASACDADAQGVVSWTEGACLGFPDPC